MEGIGRLEGEGCTFDLSRYLEDMNQQVGSRHEHATHIFCLHKSIDACF